MMIKIVDDNIIVGLDIGIVIVFVFVGEIFFDG